MLPLYLDDSMQFSYKWQGWRWPPPLVATISALSIQIQNRSTFSKRGHSQQHEISGHRDETPLLVP
jgi:hypothetical protein